MQRTRFNGLGKAQLVGASRPMKPGTHRAKVLTDGCTISINHEHPSRQINIGFSEQFGRLAHYKGVMHQYQHRRNRRFIVPGTRIYKSYLICHTLEESGVS
jgi:hypothetical protein